MIAYEELEKALARWKARRPEAQAAAGPAPIDDNEVTRMGDDDRTSMGAGEESMHGIPNGIAAEHEPASDSTGELEIGDVLSAEENN